MEFKGKVFNFLGDSITEGKGVADKANCRYDSILKKELGLERVNNYGVGGTRIGHNTAPSQKARWDLDFCGRCWDLDKSADVIVVYGGVNDFGSGDSPFGSPADTDRTTFCGSVNYLCSTINSLYPCSLHIFLTPARCDIGREISVSGHPLKDFADAILTIAPQYGFLTLNMYDNLGIDPHDPAQREEYTVDGLHFNDAGHRVIANRLIEFLKSL